MIMNTCTNSQSVAGLAGWIGLTFLAPLTGVLSKPGAWYAALNKPSFNPPAWIFGPVWSLLYTLMALAAWIVWKRGGFAAHRRALVLYLIQLALNAAWTPAFFGIHRLDLAFGVIVALWIAIALTLRAFWHVNRLAGGFFVPYLAWVSFAAFLNWTLWRLNP